MITFLTFFLLCFPKPTINSLNPVWGPEDKNTFLLDCVAAKLLDAGGLHFVVRDYDMVSADDSLGSVWVKDEQLMAGGTIEKKITAPKGHKGEDVGQLTIRCRQATKEDVEAIRKGEKKSYFA